VLIDIHTHAWASRGLMGLEGQRYLCADELIEKMDAAGIHKAVVLGGVSPEQQYYLITAEDVLRMCASYPERLIPFCGLDPRMVGNGPDSDLRPLLRHYRDAGCKGVGEYFPNLPFDDPLNMNLFSQVAEAGLPLTFHIGTSVGGCYGCYDELGLPRLEKVLKEFPNLKLLGHSQAFWAEISADVTQETRAGYPKGPVTPGRLVQLMREYPNLYGDLSAGSGYNALVRDFGFGCRFMEEFQDRLLFGTDMVYVKQETPIVAYFQKLAREELISREAHDKICWRNANTLLGLGTRGDSQRGVRS